MDAAEQLQILENTPDCVQFGQQIDGGLNACRVDILQINVGRRCNLSCKHCHVNAGPDRPEVMPKAHFEAVLSVVERYEEITTLDITGGSPEMNPDLPWFLKRVAALGRRIIVRSNLTILHEPDYAHFLELYAEYGIELFSSLPAYQRGQVDRQRGESTYHRIIAAMKMLNDLGYGQSGSGLRLNLVHNPVGAYLPASQSALESEYRSRLRRDHGVSFNSLFCLTNCPVGRYLEFLVRSRNYESYMRTLIRAFNQSAVDQVMCRTTLSVGWNGTLYDCDFNQMLDLPVNHGAPDHISRFDLERLKSRRIVVGNHCYSCTAGAGSSCQGALSE